MQQQLTDKELKLIALALEKQQKELDDAKVKSNQLFGRTPFNDLSEENFLLLKKFKKRSPPSADMDLAALRKFWNETIVGRTIKSISLTKKGITKLVLDSGDIIKLESPETVKFICMEDVNNA